MDEFDRGEPPPRGRVPDAWYEEALKTAARRDPRRAMVVARVIEGTLLNPPEPLDSEFKADVTRLTAWLRSMTKG
jgi:hypothetical protein